MDDASRTAPGAPRVAYKALIKVGYGCNEHCTFCHTLDVRPIDGASEEIERKIHRAAELGHRMVVLSGGEPTIRPELLHWAHLVAAAGLDLGLVTNGRALAYPELVDKLVACRLRYVYLSLHGGSAPVHNRLVRSDAFDQAIAALRNLGGRGLDLTANCVVTRQNLPHLRGLVELLAGFPDVTLKLSMVEPKGGAARNFDLLVPRVRDVAAAVLDAAARAAELGVRLQHGGVPRCLVPGLEDSFSDLRSHGYWTMVEVGEPDFFPVDDDNKRHPPACAGCGLRGGCPGLFRGYHEVFGDAELRPVLGSPRANSFNYTLEALHPLTDDACPLRHGPLGVTPWERGRHLFLRRGDQIARYRADTRDFTDEEIAAVKHDLGQVYVDAARGPAPRDFARELVPLARSPLCRSCPHVATCTGLFEPVFEDIFTRDDAPLRARLAGLSGDLLDLGCGEAPYADALAPRIDAGDLRYTGVDPDPAALARLRPRLGPATLLAAEAETLDLGERRFDAITVLRSYNHLRDPAAVLRRVLPRLRPGGLLVLCDNTAFGLARTPAQTRRGESSIALREHLRNDDAAAADALVCTLAAELGLSLDLEERRDVGPGTSNQWSLVYRARAKSRTTSAESPPMSLTFYYAPQTSAVRVHWALEELGVPYEKVKLDLRAGAQKHPDFLAINPNGKVPALVIDGAPMFESLAILLVLADRFGVDKGLWFRSGTAEHAEAVTWTVWGTVSVGQIIWKIFHNTSTWVPAEQHNAPQAAAATIELHEQLGILDRRLQGREYIVGSSFSLVDLANASMLGWALGVLKIDLSAYPNLAAWLGRSTQRPAFGVSMAP